MQQKKAFEKTYMHAGVSQIVKNLIDIQFMRKSDIHGWICWPVPVPQPRDQIVFQNANTVTNMTE